MAALSEQPAIKANLAVSPVLLEQLSSMAAGYSWREGESVSTASRTDEPAVAAKNWLERLKNTLAGGQVELLTSPYGQAPLPALSELGWGADALNQLKSAKTVHQKILTGDQSPDGLYLPGLLIDKRSAGWLAKAGMKYGVARPGSAAATDSPARPLPPLEFKAGRRALTIFQSDAEITDWLKGAAPEKVGAELTAMLAQRFLSGDTEDIVTIASDEPHALPSADFLAATYQTLSQTPWIKTISLSSALDKQKIPAKLGSVKEAKIKDRAYERRLRRARQDLSDFAAAVAPKNEMRQRLEHQFYVAESIDYLFGQDAAIPPIGRIYSAAVRTTVGTEFDKIELAPPAKITFSTKAGKIPVAIINRTGYPVRVRLRLTGKDFVFSDDKKEQVVLTPKENLISYNIVAGFVGLSKLKVEVAAGGRIIDTTNIEVTVSNLLRYVVVAATTLSIAGVGAVIVARGRRG